MTSFLNKAIQHYRQRKKKKFLQQPSSYKHKYAIIGTGIHNITNIYPCLWFLGIPVKIIYSRNKTNAISAAQRWPDCIGTNSLEDIINNESITGVFVASLPQFQGVISAQLLKAGKHVFVEKPIGLSTKELQNVVTAEHSKTICLPGLQRRFSPLAKKIKKESQNAINYHYCFSIGNYPEGNVLFDVFIHPIDFVIHLFGEATIVHAYKTTNNSTSTFYLLLNHNGVHGNIELSTAYSWQEPIDELCINTQEAILKAKYPYYLESCSKPQSFTNLPLEKIFPSPLKKLILMNSSFLPIAENNSLYAMGFYPQLEHFVNCVEEERKDGFGSSKSLLPAYLILETLQKLS
ncbi:MAG: oxidoreductase domain protein [Flaviaesturariibacter sp.]|nr:oxidoreductase domain protein [Flaviaesturariibacter sp.]